MIDAHHVVDRHVLGDGHDERQIGVHCLVGAFGRKLGRDEDNRRVRAGCFNRLADGVKHRHAVDLLAALAGRDARDDRGAVFQHLFGVERAFAPGNPLDDEAGVFVDKNAHSDALLSFIASTPS